MTDHLLAYAPTPVQELFHDDLERAGVRLLVKREDLNHPTVSGNKWWKLKLNLKAAIRASHDTLLTFGGAYSNHIFATAAAANGLGLKSIGIIRGEETFPLNKTLKFAQRQGMQLHYISRERYRKKDEEFFTDELRREFGNFFLIPEGGTNDLAVKGCFEWANEIRNIDCDYVALPVGTGGTIAGLIAGLAGQRQVVGISSLKGGEFLQPEISGLLEKNFGKVYGNWQVLTSYHHGGYAKVSEPLLAFITQMMNQHNLPLDPVYTGKLLWAVMDMVRKGWFDKGATVLALHTGGLQSAGD
jgi:1-aminocyclopropane-1-carboxylate deaminase